MRPRQGWTRCGAATPHTPASPIPMAMRWLMQEVTQPCTRPRERGRHDLQLGRRARCALRRASAAHGEHEPRTGHNDARMAAWYARVHGRRASRPGASVVIRLAAAVAADRAGDRAGAGAGARREVAFDHALPNIPGKSLVAIVVSYPPGGKSASHRHAPSAFTPCRCPAPSAARSTTSRSRCTKPLKAGTRRRGRITGLSGNASDREPRAAAVFVVDSGDEPLTTPDTKRGPLSMKAWRVHAFAPPEAMRFERVARPAPAPERSWSRSMLPTSDRGTVGSGSWNSVAVATAAAHARARTCPA